MDCPHVRILIAATKLSTCDEQHMPEQDYQIRRERKIEAIKVSSRSVPLGDISRKV